MDHQITIFPIELAWRKRYLYLFMMSLRYLDAWSTWRGSGTPRKRWRFYQRSFWRCGRKRFTGHVFLASKHAAMPVPGNNFWLPIPIWAVSKSYTYTHIVENGYINCIAVSSFPLFQNLIWLIRMIVTGRGQKVYVSKSSISERQ